MSNRPLRVAIATAGRFHVLDLARELSNLGAEVAFYSMLPPGRARSFGLPGRSHRFAPELFTAGALDRLATQTVRRRLTGLVMRTANAAVIARLQPCDVFIGMSGLMLEAARHAKAKYGARVFIERGSRHIRSQAEILARIPGAEQVAQEDIERDEACYELADKIVVPSVHAERSFIERGVSSDKLFRNPYGVDLNLFQAKPRDVAPHELPVVGFVGRWSLQKGVDGLERTVLQHPELQVLHAGAIGDHPFPHTSQFSSLGHIDQSLLPNVYRKMSVMALPSRQEGLALVLAQALACGVPVVCSDRSGGEDLKESIAIPEAVAIAPADDESAFEHALIDMVKRSHTLLGRDLMGEKGRSALTWRAYGERYLAQLNHFVGNTAT